MVYDVTAQQQTVNKVINKRPSTKIMKTRVGRTGHASSVVNLIKIINHMAYLIRKRKMVAFYPAPKFLVIVTGSRK